MGPHTLRDALEASPKVGPENLRPSQDSSVTSAIFSLHFKMAHFACKAFVSLEETACQHLKLQPFFEDSRGTISEEGRYVLSNEWNATKRCTRLKYGGSGVFSLDYDILVPHDTPHELG